MEGRSAPDWLADLGSSGCEFRVIAALVARGLDGFRLSGLPVGIPLFGRLYSGRLEFSSVPVFAKWNTSPDADSIPLPSVDGGRS